MTSLGVVLSDVFTNKQFFVVDDSEIKSVPVAVACWDEPNSMSLMLVGRVVSDDRSPVVSMVFVLLVVDGGCATAVTGLH